MNRYEKLEWLEQTCSESFIKDTLVLEMVRWMGEDEFEQFYDHLCRMWEIAKSPEALNEELGLTEEEGELAYTYQCR